MEDSYDFIFKVVILGDSGVGKTGITNRYLNETFIENTKTTVGVEFGAKKLDIDGKVVKIQIWDTAGQERYRSVTSAYYKGAKGVFLVYDITQLSSFHSIDKWIHEVKVAAGNDVLVFLIGNKLDLSEKREVSYEIAKSKAEELGITYCETSAKTSENINKIFEDISKVIVGRLLEKIRLEPPKDEYGYGITEINSTSTVNLKEENKKESKCC